MSFTKVAIAGVSSEVGKTTLLCRLLREFPGWEAIKMTRGHYRSCGKDPHACCVSHLLGDVPLVRSGFQQTYASDKDTGRYWEAGATNVHWVIVTNEQVEQGIELALERVRAPGVLIEGNSFLRFIDVDFTILVTGGAATKIKSSTRWAFQKASAVYLFDQTSPGQKPDREGGPISHLALPNGRASDAKTNQTSPSETVELLNRKFGPVGVTRSLHLQQAARLGWTPVLPVYATSEFSRLVERIKQTHSTSYASPRLEGGLVRLPHVRAQVPTDQPPDVSRSAFSGRKS
jgi:molybdopterin-guanine dinucleotide biosynthesis protein